MNNEIIKKAVNQFGLEVTVVKKSQMGYRNRAYPVILSNGNRVNLIIYKNEPIILKKIKNANYVSDYLSDAGLCSRKTLDPRILKLKSSTITQYAAIYEYLPGRTIPWEAYTKDHIKLLGQTMGSMHEELKKLPRNDVPCVVDEYADILKQMRQYFSSRGVCEAMNKKLQLAVNKKDLDALIDILGICRKLPNQQVLHMDFVRGNILFDHDPAKNLILSGILDFEKTAYGHKIFDIARTLAFLLVDCKYKTNEQVHKYFLVDGYIRRSNSEFNDLVINLTDKKINLLYQLVNMFLLYDFYKFLKHNPYEFLEQNEHFTRTRDLLLVRGVITT